MPTQEQMTVNERRKYLKLMLPRYRLDNRTERSRLLTEMQAVTYPRTQKQRLSKNWH